MRNFILASLVTLFLWGCGENPVKPIITKPPPLNDTDFVLKLDSLVLNTSNAVYIMQYRNFTKKLRKIEYEYIGQNIGIPSWNGAFIALTFRSDFGDSVTYKTTMYNENPVYVINNILFSIGDSCQTIKIELGMWNPTPPPDKYIKLKNLKVY